MKKGITLISAIRKWGNSPALRLPLTALQVAEFSLEQKVSVSAEKGKLTIESITRDDYSLSELVGGITAENSPELIDFGEPVGREIF